MNGQKQGVTILNVVFIILILVVVTAFLLPMFAGTHCEGLGKSTCQSNLKEVAIALQVYWNDYDSHLPSSALVSHSKTWNRDDFLTYATKIGHLPTTKGQHLQTWSEVLYDHMKSKDIMFCSSDSVDQHDPNAPVSYYWKTAIDKAWYGVGCKKPCRREGDFVYNSDIVVFYEHDAFHFGGGGLKNGAQINCAFLDSHVKTIQLRDATSGDPTNCAADLSGEPMYFNYDAGGGTPHLVPARYTDAARYADQF